MKRAFLIAGFLLGSIMAVRAQGGGMNGQWQQQTPEQRAGRMTDFMSKQIDGLTSDQLGRIKAINLGFMQSADSLRTDKSANRKARRDKMKALTDGRDEKLKEVLNDKQYKQWQDDMARFRDRQRAAMDRRDNGGGGDGGN